jgi:hypothetical protein
MKRITIVLVCALIAPLAFAQTRTNKTKQTATTQLAATTYVAGVVRTYQPSKAIVIDGTQGAVGFALGTSARIVNSAGNAVTSALTPGQRVSVYYTGTGENRAVDRVVVVD